MPQTCVAFTGHMIDRPGRPVPRFPPSALASARARIEAELDRLGAVWGCSSAATGGDILFHELMHARGCPTVVVLPCPEQEFIEACIAGMPDADDWLVRFRRVMDGAASVEILSRQCAADNAMASECCSRVVLGLATMEAQQRRCESLLLALWDGKPGDQIGGTHSIVEFALTHGRKVHVIEMKGEAPRREAYEITTMPAGTTSAPTTRTGERVSRQLICAIVFADAVGFSGLSERQLPAFAQHFLGGVNQLLQGDNMPLVQNSWGDGLYLVFGSIRDAAEVALALCEFVTDTNWAAVGLPRLNIRIGVHAGPLYQIYDPIQGKVSYMGSHVTQAARIEPKVTPGQVHVSRTFAALAAAENLPRFAFASIGEVELAKGYGRQPTYCVSRVPRKFHCFHRSVTAACPAAARPPAQAFAAARRGGTGGGRRRIRPAPGPG